MHIANPNSLFLSSKIRLSSQQIIKLKACLWSNKRWIFILDGNSENLIPVCNRNHLDFCPEIFEICLILMNHIAYDKLTFKQVHW